MPDHQEYAFFGISRQLSHLFQILRLYYDKGQQIVSQKERLPTQPGVSAQAHCKRRWNSRGQVLQDQKVKDPLSDKNRANYEVPVRRSAQHQPQHNLQC